MNNKKRVIEIEARLREHLKPLFLTVTDDSAAHRGHAGAKDGRGHFSVKITAQAFQGKTLTERHRMVYAALEGLMETEIHALKIEAKPLNIEELTDLVIKTLTDLKGKDIRVLDVHSLTSIMDTMVICTATSNRQAASMAEKLVTAIKKIGIRPFNRVEDQTETGWILVDLLDVVVHIMLPETRELYNLETLWTTAGFCHNPIVTHK